MRQAVGYSLSEALIVLFCMMGLFGLGIPALERVSEQASARNAISQLQLLLHHAREQALHLRTQVSLCPLNSLQQCHSSWNEELVLFVDSNNNQTLEAGEAVLYTLKANHHPYAKRSYTSKAIGFDANGFSALATGSLGYCLKHRSLTAAVFILSRNGRIRRGGDSNQDGIPENASGQNIACP